MLVIHIDLDCFYCQVEQKRLNIPADVPCAVQQWNGLIAVNYPARQAGISRHMRVAQALALCPDLRLVHVQTVGAGPSGGHQEEGEADGPDAAADAADAPGNGGPAADDAGAAQPAAEVEGSAADRQSSKASLQRYRHASTDIMRLIAAMCPGCPFEKASIDEAYLDVTQLAVQELAAAEASDGGAAELLHQAAEGSIVRGDGGLQGDIEFDRLAAAGAAIALRLRAAVRERLGFTCSAGIGPNKLLAKIASAMHKPNKQTVVLPRAVEGVMQDLPLGKVKGLGGKLGSKLEALGATTAGAAAQLPWESLVAAFEGKARWVWETVRGIDEEPVAPKSLVKSINSCKSFAVTSEYAAVTKWLGVLAAELSERLAEDEADNSRRPRTLVLQYRTAHNFAKNVPDRSIRGALAGSSSARASASADSLAQAGAALFKRIVPAPYPLVRLALVATDFVDLRGAPGTAGSTAAMARFLAAGRATQQQQQQQQQQQHTAGPDGAQPPGHAAAAAAAAGPPHLQQPCSGQRKPPKQQQQQAHLDQFFAGGRAAGTQAAAQAQPHAAAAAQQRGAQQQQAQPQPGQDQGRQRPAAGGSRAGDQQLQLQAAAASDGSPGPSEQRRRQQQQQQQQQQQHAPPPPLLPPQQQRHGPPRPPGQEGVEQEAGAVHQPGQQQQRHAPQGLQQDGAQCSPQQDQQQQDDAMSADEVAALAGVDRAEQARILRDIEAQGRMQQRRQQQQQRPQAQAAGAKRKGSSQQGRKQGDGKQMRISSMFGSSRK